MAFSFNDWYAENKEALNADRRTKYKNDPDHRNHVRQLNAESRTRRKEEKRKEEEAAAAARKVEGVPRKWKEFEVEVGGKLVTAFTIGALASATRRSIQSLRSWEAQGIIPGADAHSPKGDRLYTVELIEKIYDTLEQSGRLKDTNRQRRGVPHVEKTIRYADGREERVVLFLVAALARVLSRTIVTVQQMEQSGVLPETPFRASVRRYRLYTMGQIESAKKHYDRCKGSLRDEATKTAFTAAVREEWTKLGLDGATILDNKGEGEES